MPKLTKAAVRYRPKAQRDNQGKRCGNCVMFRPGILLAKSKCTLVMGDIKANDVCDRWEGKKRAT